MRSLSWKLGLSFLVVSITGALVAAIFVHNATQTNFQQVVFDRAESDFASSAASYYQSNDDSWSGISAYLQQPGDQSPPGTSMDHPPPFILTDQHGVVIVPDRTYQLNTVISASVLAKGAQVRVSSRIVGYVLSDGTAPPLSPTENAFLTATEQALIFGSLAAFLLALGIGIVLARTLTRPLRELTSALHAMAAGALQQAVPVRSQDELGQLSAAFNRMSADLALANQQRRQMTADIAHDLRTPVTVISGYLEALRDGVLPPTTERFAILFDEAQHLQGLIEDLRTLSLTDSGELILQRHQIAAAALLQRIAELYHHQTTQQRITLSVVAAETLPPLFVDVERMVQVLSNLVSNALRYTPDGGKITLGAQRYQQHDAQGIMLTVQDTGRRHHGGRAATHFRSLLSRGCVAIPGSWRIRAGTGNRQSPGRGA